MSRRWRRPLGWIICGAGGLSVLLGLWAIGGYVWGVVSVLDEADQSWVFWGLIFLFIGLGALGLGVVLFALGQSLLSRD